MADLSGISGSSLADNVNLREALRKSGRTIARDLRLIEQIMGEWHESLIPSEMPAQTMATGNVAAPPSASAPSAPNSVRLPTVPTFTGSPAAAPAPSAAVSPQTISSNIVNPGVAEDPYFNTRDPRLNILRLQEMEKRAGRSSLPKAAARQASASPTAAPAEGSPWLKNLGKRLLVAVPEIAAPAAIAAYYVNKNEIDGLIEKGEHDKVPSALWKSLERVYSEVTTEVDRYYEANKAELAPAFEKDPIAYFKFVVEVGGNKLKEMAELQSKNQPAIQLASPAPDRVVPTVAVTSSVSVRTPPARQPSAAALRTISTSPTAPSPKTTNDAAHEAIVNARNTLSSVNALLASLPPETQEQKARYEKRQAERIEAARKRFEEFILKNPNELSYMRDGQGVVTVEAAFAFIKSNSEKFGFEEGEIRMLNGLLKADKLALPTLDQTASASRSATPVSLKAENMVPKKKEKERKPARGNHRGHEGSQPPE